MKIKRQIRKTSKHPFAIDVVFFLGSGDGDCGVPLAANADDTFGE
jgi:hypothetical protein